jgi:hypothetical protein
VFQWTRDEWAIVACEGNRRVVFGWWAEPAYPGGASGTEGSTTTSDVVAWWACHAPPRRMGSVATTSRPF